jgi:hypothetical protein
MRPLDTFINLLYTYEIIEFATIEERGNAVMPGVFNVGDMKMRMRGMMRSVLIFVLRMPAFPETS